MARRSADGACGCAVECWRCLAFCRLIPFPIETTAVAPIKYSITYSCGLAPSLTYCRAIGRLTKCFKPFECGSVHWAGYAGGRNGRTATNVRNKLIQTQIGTQTHERKHTPAWRYGVLRY